MDEVYLNHSAPAPPSALWKGYGLPACPVNLSYGRFGASSHFNGLDWRTNTPSLGVMNPDLQRPWTNSDWFLSTSPSMIHMSNGVWTGFVTVSGGNHGAFLLNANNGEGVSGASAPIALVDSPAIKLVVPPGVSAASELTAGFAGYLTILLPTASSNDLPVSITLSDTNEFIAPTKVVIPAGSNTVQVPITNFDDSIADGDALVRLSVGASGYSTVSVTLTNSDDESGTLYLMVPASLPEDYSFGTEQGQVFLSEVARHDVLVRLRADPPIEIPDSLIIPKGRLSQSFPLVVVGDSLVNPVPWRARVQAQTGSWPWAEGILQLIDDANGGFSFTLPPSMVEGTTATGQILVNTPHERETIFTLISSALNLKVPTTVTLAAGSLGTNFVIEAVDNAATNSTVQVQVYAQTEGQSSISQTVSIQDDEVNLYGLALQWIPPVVFSGQPFAFSASLVDPGQQPQFTNALGQIDLAGVGSEARIDPNINPAQFTNGFWTNNILIEGEAFGVHLDVSAAGFQASSSQFDVLKGCNIPIALSDAVWNKVSGQFLVAESPQGNVPARLTEIDPWTGARGRTMDLPKAAKHVAVSADGQVAWLATTANTFQRIDLAGWHFDREYPINASNTNAFAVEIAALPGDSERFVAAVYSSSAYKLVVYDHGQPLVKSATLPGPGDFTTLVLGRTGEVFCLSYSYLSRLMVVSNGVALDRAVFVSSSYGWIPNLFYEDGKLLRGTGEMFLADTLASAEPFPTTPTVLGILCADKNKALFVEGDLLKAYDLTSHQVQGSHSFPYSIGSAPRFLRWSQNGFAIFMPGQSLTIFQTPLLTTNLPDLVLTAHVPETNFKPTNVDLANFNWEFGITNHGSGMAPAVVLHLNTGTTRSLGTLAPGEGVSVMIPPANIYMGGIASVTATVDCDLADSNPQDNTTTATIRIGTQAMPSTSQLVLGMTHLIASPTGDRLYAAVAKSAGELVDGVAVVNPETGTVEEILPIGPEPKHLAISSDGGNLYVLLGTNQLVRWNLKASTNDLSICFTNETVFDFAPVPGSPRSLVVATSGRIAVFDDDQMRPTTYTGMGERRYVGFTGNILWVSEPGYLTSLNLSSAGLSTISTRTFGRYADYCSPFTSDDTHLFFSGAIFDATQGLRHDLYGDQFAADAANGCAFTIVGNTLCKYSLGYYDLTGQQWLPVRTDIYPSAADPVRWGKGGLAFRSGQQLLMVRTPLVPDATKVNLSISITPPVAPAPYEMMEWSITLTNNSDVAAARTMFAANWGDTYDLQVEGAYSYQSYSTLLYEAGDFPAHSSATVKIRGRSSLYEGNFSMTASIQTAATDTNLIDNATTVSVLIKNEPADLGIRITPTLERLHVGDEFEAAIILTNAGPGLGKEIAIRLSGTDAFQFLGIKDDAYPMGTIGPVLGNVAPHESRTVVLRFKALLPEQTAISVSTSCVVPDPNLTDNQFTSWIYVYPNQTNQILTELQYPTGAIWAWDRSRQQVIAAFPYNAQSLFILDPVRLEPLREIPLPGYPEFIAPCDNGIHAWVSYGGGSAVRVNLETGALDLQFNYYPSQSRVYSIATPPGQSNILVVCFAPGWYETVNLKIFDKGIPLSSDSGTTTWRGLGVPMQFTPDGRLFTVLPQVLQEFKVTPVGLEVVGQWEPAGLSTNPAYSYASNRLFFVSGKVLDLSTFAVDDTLLNGSPLVADNETGFAYVATASRMSLGGNPMIISRYDVTTLALKWQQDFPMPYSEVSGILPMGTNGCLIIGNKVWLLHPDQTGTAKPDLDLALSVDSVSFEESVPFPVHVAITNRSGWVSQVTTLSLDLPSGLVFAPGSTYAGTNSATIDLGLVSRGTNLTFLVSALTNGSFTIHGALTNVIMDHAPAVNQQELLVNVMAPPIFLFDDIAVLDGAAYQDADLTGRLSRPATKDIRVSWSITLLTAQAKDFSETSGVFLFPAGRTTAICTPIASHYLPAPDKTALLTFTSSDVFLARSNALLTILNDDFPQVSVTNVTVVEGNSSITNAGFKVTLSASAPFPVDVRFQMAPGTATPGLDYISRQGWLHFNSGETVKTISVPVIGDTIYEPNETASFVLLEAVNAGFASSQGLLTIKNDDRPSPSVLSLDANTGGLQIRFQSEPGAIYQMQSRTNLTTDGWHTMPGTLQGDGSQMAFPLSEPMRDSVFFRVTAK